MAIDTNNFTDEQVKLFYTLYLPQYTILKDFYELLAEEHYDYRMVDTTKVRSDTPRESLAHMLEYRLFVLNGVKTQQFEFKSMGFEVFRNMTKQELLAQWARIDQEFVTTLNAEGFDSQASVTTPWGMNMTRVEILYLIRDHEILHVGWNLALMDHLGMPRFASLAEYWG